MQKNINENRIVKIEVITPVRIGAPSEQLMQEGIDFFYRKKEEILYYIDFEKLLNVIQEKGETFSIISNAVANNDLRALKAYLFDTLSIPLDAISYKKEQLRDKPNSEIYPFVKNGQGMPYIPGSSIKGAIRSVLFKYLYQRILNKEVIEKGKTLTPNKWNGKTYDDKIFGKIQNNIMKYVRIGDAHFESESLEINFIDLFNLYNQGRYWDSDWKGKLSITAETLKPESKASFRLGLAKPLVDIIRNQYNKRKDVPEYIDNVLTKNSFKRLFDLINKHTRAYLKSERVFFEEYNQAADTDLIITKIDDLVQHTHSENTCLLRIGYGIGFHSITGDWRFSGDHIQTIDAPDTANKKTRYKSRRIVGDSLMGFVKLTL